MKKFIKQSVEDWKVFNQTTESLVRCYFTSLYCTKGGSQFSGIFSAEKTPYHVIISSLVFISSLSDCLVYLYHTPYTNCVKMKFASIRQNNSLFSPFDRPLLVTWLTLPSSRQGTNECGIVIFEQFLIFERFIKIVVEGNKKHKRVSKEILFVKERAKQRDAIISNWGYWC